MSSSPEAHRPPPHFSVYSVRSAPTDVELHQRPRLVQPSQHLRTSNACLGCPNSILPSRTSIASAPQSPNQPLDPPPIPAAAMLTLIDADVVIVAPLASPSISTFDGCSSAFEAAAHL
ncbi:hypothetical protein D9611_010657 [Ephemerocybe angulata]|uniref:Uncharacterized protein n=1 Tax=Ephemerocybe angulata TaxID=980116 RepID=A0A8H5F1J1_9AGAR|nr:hypothetical protein D9611_010657 [Tulosesus angulatus]